MARPPISGIGGLGGYGRRIPRKRVELPKIDPNKRGRLGMTGGIVGGGAGALGRTPRVPRAAEDAINDRFRRFSQTAGEMSLPETAASRRTKQLHEERRAQALRRAVDRGRISKASLPELPLGHIPTQAYHQSHGLVRIIAYHGKGRFTVLTKHDSKVTVHRSTLSFRKDRPVSKGARTAALRQIPRDLRLVRPRDVAFPAAGMAAGAGAVGYRSHRQGDTRGRSAGAAGYAAGAGGAGEIAFRTTGMAIRDKGNSLVRTERPGQTKSQRKKAESEWRNKHGISGSSSAEARMAIQHNYKAMRDYPKSNAAAPYKRMLGHMSGPKGRVVEAGAIAAPIAGVYALNRRKVGKALDYGYRETKRSPVRTTEMLGGLGLLAYGAPRLKMLGPAAAKGIKFAEKHGGGKEARAALELADAFGARAREVTGRGETKLRQIKTLDRAIGAVPRGIRGEVATAAGVLTAANAHPTTKQRFVPMGEYG